MINDFSSRLSRLFSKVKFNRVPFNPGKFLEVFKDEIKRLLPELNKKYNLNIELSDLVIRDPKDNRFDALATTRFDGETNTIELYLRPGVVYSSYYNPSNLRNYNSFNSIYDFIKDCACHELFHVYDSQVNYSSDLSRLSHKGWWIENYNPRYLDDNYKGFDYRRSYSNTNVILDETLDKVFAIKLNNNSYEIDSRVVIHHDCIKYSDKELLRIKELEDMVSGGWIDYLYYNINPAMRYDIVPARFDGIYQIRHIGDRTDPVFLFNENLLNRFLDSGNYDYLRVVIYRTYHPGNDSDHDRVIGEMNKFYKKNKKYW